jgi:hypothetical protein
MKVRSTQHMEVYDELTEFKGSPPPGHLFDLAIEKRAVGEYLDNEIELDDLSGLIDDYADTLQKSRAIRFEARNSSSDEASQPGPADHRLDAAQRIIALEIAADEAVVLFRANNLGTGLMAFDEVAVWVERTARTDGQATLWIEMPKDSLDNVVSSDSQASLDPPPGYGERFDNLRYISGDVRHTLSVPIRFGGVLDDLSVLSRRISRWYEWDKAAAATFILTGLRPAPRGANARRVEPWPWPIARRRIALDIPLSTAPEEVANLYRRMRAEMLGGGQL